MDNLTLYSQHADPLTPEQLEDLSEGASVTVLEPDVLRVSWSDVTVTMNHMTAGPEMAEHLKGFQGFIRTHAGAAAEELKELVEEVGKTKLVIGCEIEPAFDPANRVKSFLVSMAASYERCMMFHDGCVLSPFGEVWFGHEEAKPLADISELVVRKVGLTDFPTMTPDQRERYERVGKLLQRRSVPELMKRCWVDDSDDIIPRTPQDVARRVLALHAVVCIARGRPREETMQELRDAGGESWLSPQERHFLAHAKPSQDECNMLIWKLEVLWLLMWALHHVDQFKWPNSMCEVDGLHELIFEKSKDPKAFVDQAKLRGKKALLDATQLIVQIHAVIRSSMIEEGLIPDNLDWAKPGKMVPVQECPMIGVVAERHLALNWLIGHGNADWDDVDTPTIPSAVL